MLLILPFVVLLGAGEVGYDMRPVPGASFQPPAVVQVDGSAQHIGAGGRATLTSPAVSAPGFTFQGRHAQGRAIVEYYPSSFRLIRRRLNVHIDKPATLVIRRDGETWRGARLQPIVPDSAGGTAEFTFAVSPGDWTYCLIAPGWSPYCGTTAAGTAGPIDILPAAGVSAEVRDAESGELLKTWKAYLRGGDKGDAFAQLAREVPLSSGTNRLLLASIPPGRWELVVEDASYAPTQKALQGLAPGKVSDLGRIFMTRMGALALSVTFPAGAPPGSLTLTVSPVGARPDAVKSVPIADWTRPVSVERLPPGDHDVSIASDVVGIIYAGVVLIAPGATAEAGPLEIVPRQAYGRVLDREEGIPGATVKFTRKGRAISATTDELGRFSTNLWNAGDYLLTAEVPGMTTPVFRIVSLQPDQDLEVDIAVPSHRIAGIVSDATTGRPISSATVWVYSVEDGDAQVEDGPNAEDDTDFSFSTTTDEAGSYLVGPLPLKSVRLEFSAPGYSTKESETLRPSKSSKEEYDAALEPGYDFDVRVVSESGMPIPGAHVGVDVTYVDFASTGRTDAAGRAKLKGLSAGSHNILIHKCGYMLTASTLSIREDNAERTGTWTLFPSGPTFVLEVKRNGKAATGETVLISIGGMSLPASYGRYYLAPCGHTSASDGSGELYLDFLPPGVVTFTSPGSGRTVGTFTAGDMGSVWRVDLGAN